MRNKIGIIVYSNPDYLPPIINAINILSKEFDLIVICRNQDKPGVNYPDNVKVHRLGKLEKPAKKERQYLIIKILEYLTFVIRSIFYLRWYGCRLIYSYDMHGFLSGFLSSRLGRRIPLIYHNLELRQIKGLGYIIKYLELHLAHHADRVVFCDINRARYYQGHAKSSALPGVVMNTPLRIHHLPNNELKEILDKKGFDSGTKIILYQGAINKGHSLLEVVQSMVLWPKNTIFVFFGYPFGNFVERLYNEARALNLGGRVINLNFIPYSKVFSYTVGAYLGLALYETINVNQKFGAGASNKIFEYLSCGIPVVTNDSSYFREVVSESVAYFAKYDSPDDIARTVNLALSDTKGYYEKSQAARQLHLSKFNYEEQFKTVIEYIREVASGLES